MGPGKELPPAIQELRAAMDRVRQVQEAAGLAVNLARYDAETDNINREFLDDMLDLLPVSPGFAGNRPGHTIANCFIVKDPLNVRISAGFGLFLGDKDKFFDDAAANIVIGERQQANCSPAMSEVLLTGWQRSVDNKGRWTGPVPRVTVMTVKSDHWRAVRDKAINNLHEPYSKDVLMSLFSADQQAFIMKLRCSLPGMPRAIPVFCYGSQRSINRTLNKSFSFEDATLGYKSLEERTLRSSDFEEFDVMRHMEYIVAAYGVGEAFDELKAKRDDQMPVHPAETIFGLRNYRQVTEQAGFYEHPD
jgi:hypothetical protein